MKNLAYDAFCPSCHNWWIYCDCIETFGDIGEDLAQDEDEEQEEQDDEMELNFYNDPNDSDTFADWLDQWDFDDMDFTDDFLKDIDNLLAPVPVPMDTDTSWGAANPGTLLPKQPHVGKPYTTNPTGKGKRQKVNQLYKRPYSPKPDEPNKRQDQKDILDAIRDVQDMDFTPDVPKPSPISSDDRLPGARLPDLQPSDPSVQYHVEPDVTDTAGLDSYLDGLGDFLSDIPNQIADRLPNDYSTDDIATKHHKYSANGIPEYMRPSNRSEILVDNGLPIFTGPMYSTDPSKLTKEQKDSTKYFSQEYIDFLNGPLTDWSKAVPKEASKWWDVICLFTDPQSFGFIERVPQTQNGRTVTYTGDSYQVEFPDGTVEIYKTKMKLSQQFLFNTPKHILDNLTYTVSQWGDKQFKNEYMNGTPSVIIGQNLQGRKARSRFLLRTVKNVIKIGRPTPYFSDGSGTYDRDNRPPMFTETVDVPPPVEPLTNNILNTRRLTGTGTQVNPFNCYYENYNIIKFINAGNATAAGGLLVGLSTTQDNAGDPNNELSWGSGAGNKAPLICCHEMINEFNNVPTYGNCSLTFTSPVLVTFTLDVYSFDNQTKISHDVYSRTGTGEEVILRQNATNSFTVTVQPNLPVRIRALVKCDVAQTSYDKDRGGDAAVYWFPSTRFGDIPGRLVLKEASLLVRKSTEFIPYQTIKNTSLLNGEEVGYFSLIPNDYFNHGDPLLRSDIDRFTKMLVFTNPNASALLHRIAPITTSPTQFMANNTNLPGMIVPFTTVRSTIVDARDYFNVDPIVTSFQISQQQNSLTAQPAAKERQILTLKYGSGW